MQTYLSNPFGFIRHEDSLSNNLCLVREVAVWLVFLDAMITEYDRSTGTREVFTQEAASFVPGIIFGRGGRSAGPTREAPAREGPSGRQL